MSFSIPKNLFLERKEVYNVANILVYLLDPVKFEVIKATWRKFRNPY